MNVPVIDTHQHLIYPELYPYGWTDGVPALAGKAFREEDYQLAIQGTGIVRTIFMETTPDGDHFHQETREVCRLAESPGSLIAGVIANGRPEEPGGFGIYLDGITHPKLVGIRRILHVEPDELSTTGHFVENVRMLGPRNLTFDMCFMARQLPLAVDLAGKCPDVQFILDHCGVPDVAGGALDPWRNRIRELAALPNVACKISGVIAYADPAKATADAVRPYVEHCIESFGWDRVVWGSDWPVCLTTSSIARWVSITREIVSGADLADQHKLFHVSAERIYLKNRGFV